jgi:hypothetical protein
VPAGPAHPQGYWDPVNRIRGISWYDDVLAVERDTARYSSASGRNGSGRSRRPNSCLVTSPAPYGSCGWSSSRRADLRRGTLGFVDIGDLARLAEDMPGVRRTARQGLAEWRYHGRLVARQLDDTHVVIRADFDYRDSADLASGDAGAIEDAFEAAWLLQRGAG